MKQYFIGIMTAFIIGIAGIGNAAVVDFEDLTLGDEYKFLDTVVTSGIELHAMPFIWSSGIYTYAGKATVVDTNYAGGSGYEMNLNNISLLYLAETTFQDLNLLFGETGGNFNININGHFQNFNDFGDIDGWMTPDGVTVSVLFNTATSSYSQGVLSLSGAISSFSLGGQELWVDNVTVPLPGGILLLSSGLLGIIGFHRKK